MSPPSEYRCRRGLAPQQRKQAGEVPIRFDLMPVADVPNVDMIPKRLDVGENDIDTVTGPMPKLIDDIPERQGMTAAKPKMASAWLASGAGDRSARPTID